MLRVFPKFVRTAVGKDRNWPSKYHRNNNWDGYLCNATRSVQSRRISQRHIDRTTRFSQNIVRSEFSAVSISTLPYADFIWKNIGDFGDQIALTCGLTGRSYTYEQMRYLARKFGSGLVSRGLLKGDVVGLVAPNIPEFPIVFQGVICAGGIVSPVNPVYTAEEIARQFQSSGAKFVVVASPLASKVKEAVAQCSSVQEIFVIGEVEGLTSITKLMETEDLLSSTPSINPAEDVAVLPYSSGTTGLPKGVMLTHQNLTTNLMQGSCPEMINHASRGDTMLVVLPFFHSFAMTFVLGIALHYGSRVVTLPKFEANTFLKALHDYKPTILPLVPPMLNFLTTREDVNVEDLQQLHSICCGAAPLSKALVTSFKERFHSCNAILQEGYGMTELSPVSHLTPKTATKFGTCGGPVPNTEAKVVDLNTGEALGMETEGELCVRGPQIMKGYLNNPKATKEAIDEEGWLHTGDIAVYDEEGYFRLVDRLKELIKVKAFQVAPSELEDLLLSHPNIKDAAVIGIPDEMSGELPKAYIVSSGSVTKEEIHGFVKSKVAPHKQLKGGIEFVKSIPKSNTGKVLRRELKELNLKKT